MEAPGPFTANSDAASFPFEREYAELLPEFRALDPRAIVAVNLDIPQAVLTALDAAEKFTQLEPEVVAQLPLFDLARTKKLGAYAMALSHAHTLFLEAASTGVRLRPLLDSATALRATLLADAEALKGHGALDAAALTQLSGRTGYRNVALDLQILVNLLRKRAPGPAHVATSEQDLLRAGQTAADILHTVRVRGENAKRVAAAADLRARAFTLFLDTYAEARRAALYLRPKKNEADAFVPSLYVARRRLHGKGPRAASISETPNVNGVDNSEK